MRCQVQALVRQRVGRERGVCDEASEGQGKNPRERDNAYPLLKSPIDDSASAPDGQQTRQSRRYPSDQDDVAQDADRFWRAGCRCHRDQDETKGDSDRSDEVERAGRDGVLGDPDEAGRREDADTADSDDTKADHDARIFTTSPSCCLTITRRYPSDSS